MVKGVMICGTFLTKRAIIIIAVITGLMLILGFTLLGVGIALPCDYDCEYGYGNSSDYSYEICSHGQCIVNKVMWLVFGGSLIGFSVPALVTVSLLACKLKEAPVLPSPIAVAQPYATPTIAVQPYAMPSHAVVVPQTALLYNQANPDYPQQNFPAAATTSASSSHNPQLPSATSPGHQQDAHYPQKPHPQTATTTDLPPTSPP